MLLRRQMLSAKELRLPKHVIAALIEIRDELRDGKLPHFDLPTWQRMQIAPLSKELKFFFNMKAWMYMDHECQVCCIGGWLMSRTGHSLETSNPRTKLSRNKLQLCYPGNTPNLPFVDYTAITPEQGADAIDNFLYEGDPHWERILSDVASGRPACLGESDGNALRLVG